MQKNERFIVNKETLPKKGNLIDWFSIKEIEVYFTEDKKNYIFKVEDIIRERKTHSTKILLSYNGEKYKKYLQRGQISKGELKMMFDFFGICENKLKCYKLKNKPKTPRPLRPFRLSEDGTCWVGITDKGKEFYFNGEKSEEVMKYNWHINNDYVTTKTNRKTIRLHRFVLGVTDKNIIVNHLGGNVLDNRIEKLSISDYKDNMKERKPSKFNNTGITGLTFNNNYNTYKISCTINGFVYVATYKTKDEALIDLLIIQRNYDYRHNESLYYMLDDIDNKYINKLTEKVENKLKTRKFNPIICKNKFELSEDGSFYYMYDKKNNRCKISIEDLELVKQGNWYCVAYDDKRYFKGVIMLDGKRKDIHLHRFLFSLIDAKYRNWYIDHLDGDGLNNIRENMVITDAQGNGLNQKCKGVEKIGDKYRYVIIAYKNKYSQVCNTYEEAIKIREVIVNELLGSRLAFKSKEELDNYLKNEIHNERTDKNV